MRKLLAILALGVALAFGAPDAATAQQNQQDGLINVAVFDVTVVDGDVVLVLNEILSRNDVAIGVAAQIAANICGVNVGPVAVLGRAVDRSGTTRTVCETATQVVEFQQN